MARPSRIRYTSAACIVEDKQADRIQALGSSTNLTTEDIWELSNLNKTEVIDDIPAVDVTIDSNEYGSNRTLALLADKGFGCQVVAVASGTVAGSNTVKILRGAFPYSGETLTFTGGTVTISGVGTYTVGLNPDPTATGNSRFSCASGTTVTTGHIKIAECTSTAGPKVVQSGITDSRSWHLLSILDFENAKVSIASPVKQSGATGDIHRTMYIDNAYVNRIDLSYQTRGTATENIGLETDNKRWFLNGNSNIITDYFVATSGQTAFTLSQTPAVLANGNYSLKSYQNGELLTEGAASDFSISSTTFTLATGATTGDALKIRYTAASGGVWPDPITPSGTNVGDYPGAIKQGQVEIYLTDDANNRLTRCQSARISAPMRREILEELGALVPYERPLEIPLELTVSIEFTDSDLAEFARFAGMDITTATEISITDLLKSIGMTIKVYRLNDDARGKLAAGHLNTYPIRTVTMTGLVPTSERWEVRVGSDGTQTLDFKTDNLTFSDKIY